MTDSEFNPYHKWLAIPPAEQPADHYRLLGLTRFEADADVIDAAANRQSAHVRSYALGPNAEHSQRILSEIETARIVLLTASRKAAYDRQLENEQAPASQAGPTISSCSACNASLSIQPELFGRQVQCTNCRVILNVNKSGVCSPIRTSETNAAQSNDTAFNQFTASVSTPPQKISQPGTPKKSPTTRRSVPRRVAKPETNKKNREPSVSRITLLYVPVAAIVGICITALILWNMFRKDPQGPMEPDTVAQSPVDSTKSDASLSANKKTDLPPQQDGRSRRGLQNIIASARPGVEIPDTTQPNANLSSELELNPNANEQTENSVAEVVSQSVDLSNATGAVSEENRPIDESPVDAQESVHPLIADYQKAMSAANKVFQNRIDAVDQAFRKEVSNEKRKLITYLQDQADTFTRRGDTSRLRDTRQVLDWAQAFTTSLQAQGTTSTRPPQSTPRVKRFLEDLEKTKLRFNREVDKERQAFDRTANQLRDATVSQLQQEAAKLATETSMLEDPEAIDNQLASAIETLELAESLGL